MSETGDYAIGDVTGSRREAMGIRAAASRRAAIAMAIPSVPRCRHGAMAITHPGAFATNRGAR